MDLEFEREDDGIDMCESLEKRYKREKITGAIEAYREDGKSDEDIITKIVNKYKVTRDYVLTLLALPKTA
ncbi:MAG: hypothetical protein IJU50_08565 [Lachnospiraceae bacterium]|nr:hypothetical protein [Lachnospiraceae bacterium]